MQSRLRSAPLWGIVALMVLALVIGVCAVLYAAPPGRKTVAFYTDDAAFVRAGDSVRVAGIPVGKVADIEIQQDRVLVRANVEDDVFIGDQTQVEVRMLTVVGGYYINLVSMGDKPLGDHVIEIGRVRVPYNLMQALAGSTKITERVDTAPLRASADELSGGLTGDRLDSVHSVVDAANAMVDTISRQGGQVTQILDMSAEYMDALGGFEEQLVSMIHKAAILEQTLTVYGRGFEGALRGLGDVGQLIKPLGDYYGNHREEVLATLAELQKVGPAWGDGLQPMIEELRAARLRMEQLVSAGDGPGFLATDVCVPLSGQAC